MFRAGVEKFGYADIDNPDLSGVLESGGKLLITHGTGDELIDPEGTRRYFDRVIARMGGESAVGGFARLFLVPGDGHGFRIRDRFGIELATSMIALMNWSKTTWPQTISNTVYFGEDRITVTGTKSVLPYRLSDADGA